MEFIRVFKKANTIRKDSGWTALWRNAVSFVDNRRDEARYRRWIDRDSQTDRPSFAAEIANLPRNPLLSVILPVYDIDEKWLRLCIGSVTKQTYQNWELCVADDQSKNPRVREVLTEFAAADPRIKIVFRPVNGHIAAASNSALELATGEFCILLDHDDELSPDALYYVAKEINEHPETAFIYSDEDLIDENGRRFGPKFKPDFSRDLMYSLNLITHLSAYRTEVLRAVGGFRLGTEGSQDYDLALRVLETIDESRIRHIPRVLYHWRTIRGSVAFGPGEKPYAFERAREVIREHLERCGKSATVSAAYWNLNRVNYELPVPQPKIRIVRFGEADSGNLEDRTEYANFETVRVRDRSAAEMNRAAFDSDAELLCFVDSGLTPRSPDWLRELAGFALQPEIGAVGGKIIDSNGCVAGGGIVLGGSEIVRIAHRGLPESQPGNMCRNQLISNFSAVSADCLMIRRDLFRELGGFDAATFPRAFFDADLCLRIRSRGHRVVATPYAILLGTPAEVRPSDDEAAACSAEWNAILERDPFYNPNLARTGRTFAFDLE